MLLRLIAFDGIQQYLGGLGVGLELGQALAAPDGIRSQAGAAAMAAVRADAVLPILCVRHKGAALGASASHGRSSFR